MLGVDTVWLAPFQPSPDRDDGYDIKDFYGVDPRYGSSGDFVEFMHEADKRGIRVVIDLVVNHTSNEHRWFEEARRNPDCRSVRRCARRCNGRPKRRRASRTQRRRYRP